MENYNTLINRALLAVPGLDECIKKLRQDLIVRGRSQSTLKRYVEKIAEISFHYHKLPEFFSEKEINDFLELKIMNAKSYSRSEFKHVIYGLRYYYRMMGMDYKSLKLPAIKKEKHLPPVLSVDECRDLFESIRNPKHRLILMLMYSGGLRVSELLNLKISDIDSLRMMIHVRQGKGIKDRYLPLSRYLIRDLIKYIKLYLPVDYLFNGIVRGRRMGTSSIRWLFRDALRKIGIRKQGVCLHTLRHSFATHLLEGGMDIISIKELLGHARLETTLVYLHVADYEKMKKCSPLDMMYKSEIDKLDLTEKVSQLTSYAPQRIESQTTVGDQLQLF
jgi:site-specific recombinase XerD